MPRDFRVTFVCDRGEHQALATLARKLRRSRSDVVRLLIRDEAERQSLAVPADAEMVPQRPESFKGARGVEAPTSAATSFDRGNRRG
jgi:hypothetical protein